MTLKYFVPRVFYKGSSNTSLTSSYSRKNSLCLNGLRHFHQGPGKLYAAPVANRTISATFKKKPVVVSADKGKVSKNVANMDNWNINKASKIILPELNKENGSEENINTVFSLPSSITKKLGSKLIPKHLNDEFSLVQENGLLYRKCTFDLNRQIEDNKEKSSLPLILDGKSGLGKSALLFQLVSQRLISQEWLVIYIPHVKKFTNGSLSYAASTTPDIYTQSTAASEFLSSVLNLNSSILEKINLCDNAKIGSIEYTKENTLLQIVQKGSESPKFATSCLRVFFDTISKQTTVPVLLALDEVNAVYGTTEYYNQDGKKLAATNLLFVRLLADFLESKKILAKGIVVGATSWVDKELVSTEFGSPIVRDVPKEIVTSKTQSGCDVQKYWVPSYSLDEAKAITKYYKDAAIISQVELPQEVEQKLLMSGGNGSRFFRLSTRFL